LGEGHGFATFPQRALGAADQDFALTLALMLLAVQRTTGHRLVTVVNVGAMHDLKQNY
jgi:hypothetical protein